MPIVADIETIPQCKEALEKAMPGEIRCPEMPPEIAKPTEPDWAGKCPLYGLPDLQKKLDAAKVTKGEADGTQLAETPDDDTDAGTKKAIGVSNEKITKARAAAADKLAAAERAVEEVNKKRAAWIEAERQDFMTKTARAQTDWQNKVNDARRKFIDGAALDARIGSAKLLAFRDTSTGLARVFIFESDKAKIKPIRAWFGGLMPTRTPALEKLKSPAKLFRDRPLMIHEFMSEAAAIAAFFAAFHQAMSEGNLMSARYPANSCVTYYGNSFDFPFLHQRAWILGKPIVPMFRRGRYWDETRMIDLYDLWTFGDRQVKCGGLDGLATALGCEGAKTQDGQSFHEWYATDPVEGVVYLLNDLDITEFCGRKMGVIADPNFEPEK